VDKKYTAKIVLGRAALVSYFISAAQEAEMQTMQICSATECAFGGCVSIRLIRRAFGL